MLYPFSPDSETSGDLEGAIDAAQRSLELSSKRIANYWKNTQNLTLPF